MRRHITITMDVDPAADSPLLSVRVHPKECGLTEEDVKAMLSTK